MRRKKQCGLIFHFEYVYCVVFSSPSVQRVGRGSGGKVEKDGWGKRVFVDGYKKDHTQKN